MNATPYIEWTLRHAQALWDQAVAIWIAGGWAMAAIALNALVMFALGTHVWLRLRERGFHRISERRWRKWMQDPVLRRGPVGRMFNIIEEAPTLESIALVFQELRQTEVAPFRRELRLMKVCIGVGPLLGLFGTVTGMLATFGALAGGSGGEETMAMVAKGISEALITTETGLVIALPGLFFQYQLARRHDAYHAFLAQLETAFTQKLYWRLKAESVEDAAVTAHVPMELQAT